MNAALQLSVVAARPSDLTAIEQLLGHCGLPHSDLTVEHLERFQVVWQDAEIIAVGGLEKVNENGLVRSLAVAAKFRRRRIGQSLLEATEAAARQSGIKTLYLLTISAEAFFANRGYKVVSRSQVPLAVQATTEFAGLCPDTAVCMRKTLRSEVLR